MAVVALSLRLYVSGLYSATTRKQIGYFLKEYVPQLNYYDIKCAYYSNHMINIHTGEIKNFIERGK